MEFITPQSNISVFIPETSFKVKLKVQKVNDKIPEITPQIRLFSDDLEDIYYAEKAFIKAIPEMIKNCTSEEMAITLTGYFNLAVKHVTHFEKLLNMKNSGKKSKKIVTPKGFIDEANEVMFLSESVMPGLFI